MATAPDELMTIVVLTTAPAGPFRPASVHGQPVVIIGVCYAGPVDEGEHAIAPLRRIRLVGPRPSSGLHVYVNSLGEEGEGRVRAARAQADVAPTCCGRRRWRGFDSVVLTNLRQREPQIIEKYCFHPGISLAPLASP